MPGNILLREVVCAQRGDPDLDVRDRLKTIEAAVLAFTRQDEQTDAVSGSQGIRRAMNSTGCTFPRCRHSQCCSACGGNHLQHSCIANRREQGSANGTSCWDRRGSPHAGQAILEPNLN